jgi:hypothetical protein
MSSFFGLTPQYRSDLFSQIHDLVYHGGGGFLHSEVYNMPIWMRRFHIQKINEWNKKQNEEMEKQNGKSSPSSKPMGPSITPSSTYNFKG